MSLWLPRYKDLERYVPSRKILSEEKQKMTWKYQEEWDKILVEKLKDTLFAIVSPRYWTQIHPFSEEWNTMLKDLMKKHNFEIIDEYTARLGDVVIWYRNHPYGSFVRYGWGELTRDDVPQIMSLQKSPARRTIHYAMRKLIGDCICDNRLNNSALNYLLKCRDMYKSIYY
jgi:hypothetical protein